MGEYDPNPGLQFAGNRLTFLGKPMFFAQMSNTFSDWNELMLNTNYECIWIIEYTLWRSKKRFTPLVSWWLRNEESGSEMLILCFVTGEM
jgi:hypothetical protein